MYEYDASRYDVLTYRDTPVVVVAEQVDDSPVELNVKYPFAGLVERHPQVMLNWELGEPAQVVDESHQLTSI